MQCQYDQGFMTRYLNKELDNPSKKAFENHLKLCTKCQLELESYHKNTPATPKEQKVSPVKVSYEIPKKKVKFSDGIIANEKASPSLELLKKMAQAKKRKMADNKDKPLAPYQVWLKTYGIPVFSAVLLMLTLIIPTISKPLWGGVWSFMSKDSQEAISQLSESEESLVFQGGFANSSLSQLIELLNERGMGVSPWEVLYADEEKVFIRNHATIIGFKDGSLYQVADLDALKLNHIQGSIVTEFSFSPTGDYLIAGNNVFEGENRDEATGVYLINTKNGKHAPLIASEYNQLAYAWSFDGRYLAFTGKNGADSIHLFDTEEDAVTLFKREGNSIKSLFVSYNGKISFYTGNQIMTASLENANWRQETLATEPVYLDPETGRFWFISDGHLMRDILGSSANTAIDLTSQLSDAENQIITNWRITRNFLVYRLTDGDVGLLDLQSGTTKHFNLGGNMAVDYLPWHDVSRQGTRIMLDQDGTFVVSNGREVTSFSIPDYSALSPLYTRWLDEENIVYVTLLDPANPKAGEFALVRISAATGKLVQLIKTTDQEMAGDLSTPEIKDINTEVGRDTAEEEVYEKIKANGNWVETLVIKTAQVKNGPSERYKEFGEIPEGEIVIYNDKNVNGWHLAMRVYGSKSPKAFWISADSLYRYNRESLPAGIITDEKVALNQIELLKGNLIRIIIVDGDKSFIIADNAKSTSGITGWINNSSYSQDLNNVYMSQAYLRSGSVIYTQPNEASEAINGYADFTVSDLFVNLTDQRENEFIYVTVPNGSMTGWVRQQDLYVPASSSDTDSKPDSGGYDLDGDGIKDTISLKTDGSSYTLMVNNASAGGTGEQVQSIYKIVNLDSRDDYLEVVVEEYGPSDDYQSTFYHYNGESLILMGKVGGLCGNKQSVKGNGVVLSTARGSVLETWFYQDEYRQNEGFTLYRSPKNFYQKLNYKEAMALKLLIPFLPFRKTPGSEEMAFTLNQGEEVRFVGSDNVKWCLFETMDGRQGWLEISGFWDVPGTGLNAGDIFEGLSLAD